MKRGLLTTIFSFLLFLAFAQEGHQIKITLKPFTEGFLYLGHHFGSKQYIIDSAALNDNSEAVFSGKDKLMGGVYMVIFPRKNGWFEMLIDKQQHFSVSSDTADIIGQTQFTSSSDNTLFQQYQKIAQEKGKAIQHIQKQLTENPNSPDAAKKKAEMNELNNETHRYRETFAQQHPDHLLTSIFSILKEPTIPEASHHPGGRYDSAYAYQYYKQHFWDGVSFDDERLARTPVFEPKLKRYFSSVLPQHPDSLSKEAIRITNAAESNKEMFKVILSTLTERYINPEYMGQDAVFLNLFEKYYAPGKADYWLNEKYKKVVFDRAYSLISNQIGGKAADMKMVDSLGKPRNLYSVNATYTVVCFWDPTCGHCQTEVPKVDSLFQTKWKSKGVQVYGVMTEGGKPAWLKFIREKNIKDWIHVHQLPEVTQADYDAGRPGYKQLFDVYQTPVLYLLDKDKNIIAKKLNPDQMNDILQLKFQGK